MPAALLWDMDGTIVDTEPLWIAAETALVETAGGTWTRQDGLALVGRSLLASARIIVERGGLDLSPESVVSHLLARVSAEVRRRAPFRPGARELLAEARTAGLPCALVTMSYRPLADAVVAALPAGTFAATVTGEEVERPKPHPEPYLAAARLLGVDPAACVAIEDSPAGLASARAAGCRVVAAPLHVPLEPDPEVLLEPELSRLDLGRLCGWVAGRRVDPA